LVFLLSFSISGILLQIDFTTQTNR